MHSRLKSSVMIGEQHVKKVRRGLRSEKMRSSAKGSRATLFFWRARSVEDHAVACHHSRPASALQLLTYY